MDAETLKTMPEYVQNLPKKVQDFVFDGVWEERTQEIATKYSLTEKQTDTFINKVLFVLIGLETPEDFTESLIPELDISKLLATQMMEDLEKRVFEYAVGEIERPAAEVADASQASPAVPLSKAPEEIVENKIEQEEIPEIRPEVVPEIKPEMLPMVEENEKVHTNPPPSSLNLGEKSAPQPPENLPGVELPDAERPDAEVASASQASPVIPSSQAPEINLEKTYVGSEFIQRPIGVPRFTDAPTVEKEKISLPQNPNPAQTNLNPTQEKPKIETPPPPKPPEKYTVDPYREPIE